MQRVRRRVRKRFKGTGLLQALRGSLPGLCGAMLQTCRTAALRKRAAPAMKKKKNTDENKGTVKTVEPASRKSITASGNVRKQYPPVVGYHGTDKEKNLNAEE
jgi:hypothetical protein